MNSSIISSILLNLSFSGINTHELSQNLMLGIMSKFQFRHKIPNIITPSVLFQTLNDYVFKALFLPNLLKDHLEDGHVLFKFLFEDLVKTSSSCVFEKTLHFIDCLVSYAYRNSSDVSESFLNLLLTDCFKFLERYSKYSSNHDSLKECFLIVLCFAVGLEKKGFARVSQQILKLLFSNPLVTLLLETGLLSFLPPCSTFTTSLSQHSLDFDPILAFCCYMDLLHNKSFLENSSFIRSGIVSILTDIGTHITSNFLNFSKSDVARVLSFVVLHSDFLGSIDLNFNYSNAITKSVHLPFLE
ncbi:hypothetical protein GEMRC1_007868 [Eukaryota sp. GEM-RC1]